MELAGPTFNWLAPAILEGRIELSFRIGGNAVTVRSKVRTIIIYLVFLTLFVVTSLLYRKISLSS